MLKQSGDLLNWQSRSRRNRTLIAELGQGLSSAPGNRQVRKRFGGYVRLQSVQTVLTQKSYLIVPGTSAPRERGVGFVASSSNDYEDQSS